MKRALFTLILVASTALLHALETPIAPLDGTSQSSTFETSNEQSLPALGWTNVSGAARVFDLATNGALIGTTPYDNYEVQHATSTVVAANTHYRVRVKMGFFAGLSGATAGYRLELGTVNGGVFSQLGITTGSVSYAGYIGSGTASGNAVLDVYTGGTVSGDALAVRWAQTSTTGAGTSDFFGMDDVVLSMVTEGPGSLDSLNLNMTNSTGSEVRAFAVQPDGKTLIAGNFTSVLGVARHHIARLNADGSLDTSFDPNPNGHVLAVAVQPDGSIVLGGEFTTLQPNGGSVVTRNRIARLTSSGALDLGFDPNANERVRCIALQPDGRILIGGGFGALRPNGAASATSRQCIARLHADGTVDAGFDPMPNDEVTSILLQLDGKILFSGFFTELRPNGTPTQIPRSRIARLAADGSLDLSFDPNLDNAVRSMEQQPNGQILIGGLFTTLRPNGAASTISKPYLARLNVDGTVDAAFDPRPNFWVFSLDLQADGKILAGGLFSSFSVGGGTSTARSYAARLHANGTLDADFDPNPTSTVNVIMTQADGKVLLGGFFGGLAPNGGALTSRPLVARLFNDPATQTLIAPTQTLIQWLRGGSAPELNRVLFDVSTDNGVTFGPSVAGMRLGNTANWQAESLNLPAGNLLVRARGVQISGGVGSEGLVQQSLSVVFSPEIRVTGNFIDITDGSSTPSSSAHTDFNNAMLGTSMTRTFTIQNLGNSALHLNGTPGVVVSGANSGDFVVTVQPATTIPVGGSTTFSVAFTQGGTGQFGGGIVSTGAASDAVFLDTGWATNLSESWTISLCISNAGSSSSIGYFFGDVSASSFRCLTNGAAGAGNLLLRGPFADVFVLNAVKATPNVTTFVYDAAASQLRAYLNGVLVTTVAQGPFSLSGSGPFKVCGYSNSPGAPAGTVIDEFRMYNRALSATEIAATWNIPLPFPPPTALESFRQQYFGTSANTGNAADQADFDGDGVPNLLEFAFGLNPTQASSFQVPQAQLGGGNLFFNFTQPGGVTGVTYGAEWSTTLQGSDWHPIANTGTGFQHVFSMPTGAATRLFMRWKIQTP